MSAPYLGDFPEDQTVRFTYSTNDADGASITKATDGTVSVYKDGGVTQTTTGVVETENFDSLTGVHLVTITTTDAFYVTGSDYDVVLSASTIDGQTVNATLAHFSIENRLVRSEPPTAAVIADAVWDEIETGHTDAGKAGEAIWTKVPAIETDTGTTLDTKLDTAQADLDLLTGADGATLATSQANYAPATAAALSTHDGKLDTVDTNIDTLLTRITSTLFAGITSLAEWLGLMAGKQVGDTTARTEMRATGAGSGTFDETADSQEAIADGGGGGGATAAQVWEYATRVLTAGTNLNDVSAAEVNAQCDTALADYDAPTKTEMDAKIDALNNLSAADVNTQCDTALSDYDPPTYTELLNFIRVLARSDAALGTDLSAVITALNTDLGSGAGDYANTADSQEAIADGGGGGGATAAQVWEYATRVLTAGTNLNDISTAEVNAECDTALADYDGPTKAELDSGLAALNDLSAAEVNAQVDAAIETYNLDHIAGADAPSAPTSGSWLGDLIQADGADWQFSVNALERAPSGTGSDKFEIIGDLSQREDGEVRWGVHCEKNGQPEAISACTVKLIHTDGDGTITDYAGATETQDTDDENFAINGGISDPGFTLGDLDYMHVGLTCDGGPRVGIVWFKTPVRTV